jgi:hypothetical protein
MQLNVRIKDRIATYLPVEDGYLYVCGNGGDTILFDFDEEWGQVDKKTARFVAGGEYTDVEFSGDTCEIPVFKDTEAFIVGVYAGEPAEQDEEIMATTGAVVECLISIRDSASKASPETGENYTNEARGYAAEAKAAAEEAKAFGGMKKVGELVATVSEAETPDGMFDICLGGQPIGDDGVIVLRRARQDGEIVQNTYCSAILNLFRNAKIVEVKIDPEGLDPNNVMNEDNFGVEVGFGGLIYCGDLGDYDEFPGMHTPDERLSVYYYDNPNNPSSGYGNYFLKLNSAHARAICNLAFEGGVKLTFTAYN